MNARMIRIAFVGGLVLAPITLAQTPAKPAPVAPQPTQQIDQTFAAWDTNHDKVLSIDEFRTGARNTEITLAERRLQAQFNAVDKNHDRFIDAEEYKALLLVKRAGTAAPALSAFDANKDQKLDFAEYTALVRKLASAPAPQPAKP